MKKLILTLFVIVGAFLLTANILHAQEVVVETETPVGIEETSTPSAVTKKTVDYELPYPGMLPDNPLYFLKMIRDGVVKMLINEDMTRARFSLKNAEKRVYAGKMLVEKGKDELAYETISKGTNYLDECLQAVSNAKKKNPKNPDIKPFLHQVDSATAKNIEVIEGFKSSLDKSVITKFEKEEKRIEAMHLRVERLLKER